MNRIALAVVVALCACDSAPDWPELDTLYAAGSVVTCSAPAEEDGDATSHHCTWERVLVDGDPACWSRVDFVLDGTWVVSGITRSTATCDE